MSREFAETARSGQRPTFQPQEVRIDLRLRPMTADGLCRLPHPMHLMVVGGLLNGPPTISRETDAVLRSGVLRHLAGTSFSTVTRARAEQPAHNHRGEQ